MPVKTLRDLQWEQLLSLAADQAQTPEGVEVLRALSAPATKEAVEERLQEVGEVMELLETDSPPPLGGLRDLRRALRHVEMEGVLGAEELSAVARTCDVAARTHRYFQSRRQVLPRLSRYGAEVDDCNELRRALSHAIEPGGQLSDDASPDLRRLRRAVQNQHDRLRTKVDQLRRSDRFEHALQDDYVTIREERYVLPVRSGARGHVSGILHGTSSSGQTAFIEPTELIEANNQLKWAQVELQEEIERILRRLSRLVASHAETLRRNGEILTYLDVVVAKARFGRKLKATIPTLTEDTLELKRARHPLLEQKTEAVPNDIALSEPRKVLVISGPNTGGKTVSLKTAGLCALMARFGLPIPAEQGSSVPYFEAFYTDIGDEQSIERDLSTFSGHVTNIRGFLERCGPGSLVLLDELFVGTDPLQGAALAVGLLEELADRGATTVVTTHLEGLKTLAYRSDAFANASMGFDLESLSPTYQMTLGVPGSSFAVRIAHRLGLQESILNRAEEILEGQEHHGVDQVLEGLEDQVRELESEKARLETARRQAEKRSEKFHRKYRALLDKDRASIFEETRTLRKELREARETIREQLKTLRKEKTVEAGDMSQADLQAMQERLREAEGSVAKAREKTRPPQATKSGLVAVAPDELEVGMVVYVGSFKRQGEVRLVDEDAGQVQGQIGDLKVTVGFDDVYHGDEEKRRAHATGKAHQGSGSGNGGASREAGEAMLLPQTSENSVDLRGMRVDEALEKVDLFLDQAYLQDLGGVYLIHGHGTGALKRAVRGHLPQSRYVDRFRRGERGEGGDGVTIAFLRREA